MVVAWTESRARTADVFVGCVVKAVAERKREGGELEHQNTDSTVRDWSGVEWSGVRAKGRRGQD